MILKGAAEGLDARGTPGPGAGNLGTTRRDDRGQRQTHNAFEVAVVNSPSQPSTGGRRQGLSRAADRDAARALLA
jgi:hypothetical protein